MNRRYDNYLVKKYVPLYRDRFAPMNQTSMCWGFEVGDGWFNIINTLSYMLCREWLKAQKDYEDIKDREGELELDYLPAGKYNDIITKKSIQLAKDRMEQEAEKVPIVTQVKEKYGSLRFYTDCMTDDQKTMINFATCLSASTCEICGKKGKLPPLGWLMARCKEHNNV